jgi:hypothetical protein
MLNVGTVLGKLIKSFCVFKEAYGKVGNNFMGMQIYCNNSFGYGRGMISKLDEDFFSITELGHNRDRLLKITWLDLTVMGELKGKIEVEDITGCRLTNEKYGNLVNAYNIAKRKYGKEGEKTTPLAEFINRFKKGSKNFRKIINLASSRVKLLNSRQVNTFCRLIDCGVPDTERVYHLFTTWNNAFYPCYLRVFLFKYYNNILGTNSRVSHFNNTIDGGCTFCHITGPNPVPQETVLHIFFDCPTVNVVVESVCERFLDNIIITKDMFFLGNYGNETDNKTMSDFFDIVRYLIWQAKLEKRLPRTNKIVEELYYLLRIILGSSSKINERYNNSIIFQNGGQRRQADGLPP